MSHKSGKIEQLIAAFRGRDLDPHYLAYFDCFNRQLFFEAHDVVEAIWLGQRRDSNGPFYKGLIQLAGAFVHLQKNRLAPAAALFRLARENLSGYPETHDRLDLPSVRRLIEQWLGKLEAGNFASNPLTPATAPVLLLNGIKAP